MSWNRYPNIGGKPIDRILRIGCGDSGAGGAMFLIDAYKAICDFLIRIASEYHVHPEFVHVGDATNAPYGGKSHEAIADLTRGFVGHMAKELECHFAIIACNTASTTYDDHMRAEMKQEFPGTRVHEIIIPTSKSLREAARLVPNNQGKHELHIGILATRATTLSQKYHIVLADLHRQQYGDAALTVVINNDPFIKAKLSDLSFQFTRLFKGNRPIQRHSPEEAELFKSIRENRCSAPVQFLHVHAPANWVSIIERKGSAAQLTPTQGHALLMDEVKKEMNNFFTYARSFYGQHTDTPLKGLSVVGLCCTHYPYVLQQIKESLWAQGLHGTAVVSQGAAFAKDVLKPGIEKWMSKQNIAARDTKMPINRVSAPPITSYTTVDPEKPGDVASAEELKSVCKLIDPAVASRINYQRISPIRTTRKTEQ